MEIKIGNALTESRGAENPAESNLLNGPQRVQSKVLKRPSILQRKAYVSCREYVCIPIRVRWRIISKQGGTAESLWRSVLDSCFCHGRLFFLREVQNVSTEFERC